MAENENVVMTGQNLERAQTDNVRRRFEEQDRRLASRGLARETPTIFVKMADPSMRLPDNSGGFFSRVPVQVAANDVYIARRLRDGSLIRISEDEFQAGQVQETPEPAPPVETPEE